MVAEQQLQRWRPGASISSSRFAPAEVHVLLIVRNRQIERRNIGVHQQVMMARILAVDAGWYDAETFEPEHDRDGTRDPAPSAGEMM